MTKTSADYTTLLTELRTLLRLTRAEAQIARVRVPQARRDDIRRELVDNARQADARASRLQTAIRRLGGTPDVFSDALGRASALAKTVLEQGQSLSDGLLSDLALEHQLRDRALFTRVLAEAQNQSTVVTLMRELEHDHTETIEWIILRLAEVGQGGPAALSPTPAQAAASTVTRIATLPTRQGAALVNRAVQLVHRGRDTAGQAVGTARDKVQETARATSQVIGAGRDAALARAEQVAPSAGVRRAVHQTREDLGTIEARDLPINGYEDLSVSSAIEAIKKLDNADDVRLVLRFELAHKARKGVAAAAQKQISELAALSVSA